MQVATPTVQHAVMIEAVENHMPQVIVIDEIGTEQEATAARTIAERGVQLIGTAHGNNLDNLMLNPTLSDLIGGIQSVTLGDEEARRRRTQKSVLERKAPPTFDVIVEIQDREKVMVHSDVAETVEEDEVTRLQVSLVDGAAVAELGRRIVRERDPEPAVDVRDETGAVEAVWPTAAVAVGRAELECCDPDGPLPERQRRPPRRRLRGERHGARKPRGVVHEGEASLLRYGLRPGDGCRHHEREREREQADAGEEGHERGVRSVETGSVRPDHIAVTREP